MARLSADQIELFRNEGFLVVDDLLDPARDLDPVIAEYQGGPSLRWTVL